MKNRNKTCKICKESLFNRSKHAIYCKRCLEEKNKKNSKETALKRYRIIKILKKKYNTYSLDKIIAEIE